MSTEAQPGKYFTIGKSYGPEEIKEKGSRFIAFIYPVSSKESAEDVIRRLWKKYYDATHICYAYRLGQGREEYFRVNDDGEPSGTAGMPIYNEIKSKDYLNVLAAVVRFYGGTKLGTGGLARAYSQSARAVLNLSEKKTVIVKKEVFLSFPYDFTGQIMQVIQRFAIEIKSREDTPQGVNMKLAVPITLLDQVAAIVKNKSSGKIELVGHVQGKSAQAK